VAQRRAGELQAVIENMVDGVFVCDAEGRITLANEAALRMLGVDTQEEAGANLAGSIARVRIRHLDTRPVAHEERAVIRALAGETITAQDTIVYDPRAQRDKYIRTSAAPIRDTKGTIMGAVAVARDVTELTELDRLKDQFIAVAAHELKTPVAIMKGYAQALLRTAQDIPPPRRNMLEAIDRGADRIDRIVKDLLDISQLQVGRLDLAVDTIDLAQLAELVVDELAVTADRHRIRLVKADPVVVHGDQGRLEQVLVDLIDNAIRYSPKGGDIDVGVALGEHEVVVSVKDCGVGIPRDKQGSIFQRFYRAHANTPYDYGGMGVGLYISKEIVSRHGGRMWFESEEGRGSTFYFGLPLGR